LFYLREQSENFEKEKAPISCARFENRIDNGRLAGD